MFRSLTGYIFGKGGEDEKPKPMDFETQETEDWLVVNLPEHLVENNDIKESSKSMEDNKILSTVPILMAQQNLDCDELNAQRLENYFSTSNENATSMCCIHEFEVLGTEASVLLPEQPRFPNQNEQLAFKAPKDDMVKDLKDEKSNIQQENTNEVKVTDEKEPAFVEKADPNPNNQLAFKMTKTRRKRMVKMLNDIQQEISNEYNSTEKKELTTVKKDEPTNAQQNNLNQEKLGNRRLWSDVAKANLKVIEVQKIKADKELKDLPVNIRQENVNAKKENSTKEKEIKIVKKGDVVNNEINMKKIQKRKMTKELKDLQVSNIQQENVNAKKEKLTEEKEMKIVKRADSVKDQHKSIKIQKRKIVKKLKILPVNIQKENVNAKKEKSTEDKASEIVKVANSIKDQLKLNATLDGACGSKNSSTYSNHNVPVLRDLLQRIEQLKPQQKAKAHELNVEIVRGKLDRHNKNYIYESSAKTNRRKDRQRKSSGVNNNRRC